MKLAFIGLLFILLQGGVVLGGTKQEWKKRTVYQLLTDRFHRGGDDSSPCKDLKKYCGGTFKGITSQLTYIKRMGFDAIWISPIPENQGEDYHGYALLNMYRVNPRFGTAPELRELVQACHKLGIWVMLDVVANHVACVGQNFSAVTPFNKEEHYNSYCEIDFEKMWQNRTMRENCRLFCLPDLNQSHPFVRGRLKEWINRVVKDYGFDGIRIDTVAHVPLDFWKEYAEASGVFQVGEVFNADSKVVAEYQSSMDSLLNYPLYDGLQKAFGQHKSMLGLKARLAEISSNFTDISVLGNFVDNHDNARFLNLTYDLGMFKNALVFVLFAEGIPIVYYGSEQGFHGGADPNNREELWGHMHTNSDMYKFMHIAIKTRKDNKVWERKFVDRSVTENLHVFSRGMTLICTTNTNEETSAVITNHPFAEKTKVCNVFNTRDCLTVKDGKLTLKMKGEPKIYVHAYQE